MIKGWLNPSTNPQVLIAKYLATGESKYLSELVVLFNQPLFHYVLSQSDQHTAEDVIQTTWLKVMKANTSTMKSQDLQVKAWLFSIARNTLIDELRRQKRWQQVCIVDDHFISNSLEADIAKADSLAKFNYAISQLAFYQREAFIFQQEGFSLVEICQLTNENFETVKSRLRYARNNIKAIVGSA